MEDTEFNYRLFKKYNYNIKELDKCVTTHIHLPTQQQNNPFRTRKASDMLSFIKNSIYFYKKYQDEEILETLNTIPDFEEFLDQNFLLEEKIKNPIKQTLINLENQVELYENYIINNKEEKYEC